MKGDEVLVMTSLVIIFGVFLRRRRSFIQQMRLKSLQMTKMRRNLLILSIQQPNNIQWVYSLRTADAFPVVASLPPKIASANPSDKTISVT